MNRTVRTTTTLGLAMALAAPVAAQAAPTPDHLVTEIAHRGASFEAPENTLAAFQEGIDDRSDLNEIDVQRSKDGVLVVIHDTTLTRTTDVEEVFPDRAPYAVGDFTYEELRQLDAGSWKGAEFAGEPIPTLEEVIDQARRSRTGLLIEVKAPQLYPGIAQDVADSLAAEPGYLTSAVANDRLVVQSFNWEFMAEFTALVPSVPAGLLGTPTVAQLPSLTWADQINPHFSDVTPEYVAAVHAVGMDVNTWTVDDPAQMRRVIDAGVDGIITNRPDVLNEVVGDRN